MFRTKVKETTVNTTRICCYALKRFGKLYTFISHFHRIEDRICISSRGQTQSFASLPQPSNPILKWKDDSDQLIAQLGLGRMNYILPAVIKAKSILPAYGMIPTMRSSSIESVGNTGSGV
jgi:hypothetical protein